MHPNRTYSFQARHVETFFQLKLGTICKGTVLPLLMKNSAASRMRQPFEVGDVDDEGGVEFLMTNYKRSREVAEEAVKEVTGGRFSLLNQVGSLLKRGMTVSEIRDVYYTRTNKSHQLSRVSWQQRQHDALARHERDVIR